MQCSCNIGCTGVSDIQVLCNTMESNDCSFFPPVDLPPLGECWDGGLAHNNPAALCRQEIRYLWPWEPPLGVLVSFGTGRPARTAVPSATRRRRLRRTLPRRRAWNRLYRTLMNAMDGEASWAQLLQQVDEATRERLLRVNAVLPGPEPAIDAAHTMGDLDQMAWEQGIGVQGYRALWYLLSVSLFLELESVPLGNLGEHHCMGIIRCRLSGDCFLSTLDRLGMSVVDYLLDGVPLGVRVANDGVCRGCGRYVVPVRFSVRSVDQPITLSLLVRPHQALPVGGSGCSAQWFIDQQGFEAVFGTPNHGALSRSRCRECERRMGLDRR